MEGRKLRIQKCSDNTRFISMEFFEWSTIALPLINSVSVLFFHTLGYGHIDRIIKKGLHES